ncbi:MAG: hypothetical protein IPH18_17970 [Chitinophagaceae bacterium]|nr:hypothetical protein [Chitinophagaceae bacterium]
MEAVSSRNNLPLTTSDFDMGHRIYALASKKFSYAKAIWQPPLLSHTTGNRVAPYSYVMNGAAFLSVTAELSMT